MSRSSHDDEYIQESTTKHGGSAILETCFCLRYRIEASIVYLAGYIHTPSEVIMRSAAAGSRRAAPATLVGYL
eukprot:scaffold217384_cov16-Prasinocladus_malaysianus.AAC.1